MMKSLIATVVDALEDQGIEFEAAGYAGFCKHGFSGGPVDVVCLERNEATNLDRSSQ
jgi:hypothetical protein